MMAPFVMIKLWNYMLSCCPDLYTFLPDCMCGMGLFKFSNNHGKLFWFSESLAFISSVDWAIFTGECYDIYCQWLYDMRSVDLWISLQQIYIYVYIWHDEKIHKCHMASQFKVFSLQSWKIIYFCHYILCA